MTMTILFKGRTDNVPVFTYRKAADTDIFTGNACVDCRVLGGAFTI